MCPQDGQSGLCCDIGSHILEVPQWDDGQIIYCCSCLLQPGEGAPWQALALLVSPFLHCNCLAWNGPPGHHHVSAQHEPEGTHFCGTHSLPYPFPPRFLETTTKMAADGALYSVSHPILQQWKCLLLSKTLCNTPQFCKGLNLRRLILGSHAWWFNFNMHI